MKTCRSRSMNKVKMLTQLTKYTVRDAVVVKAVCFGTDRLLATLP